MSAPTLENSGSLHRALGLTDEEAAEIARLLGREPNHLELAMYAVMWSEHCSYKSSRVHLKRLPTKAPWVLVGPGENAGVIDAGDGIAVAIRIESHNHPSAVEPYQGAATGAGGILRDIFTMGARPIALMDALRVGPISNARSRWHLEGIVSGVSGYGNSVGVPNVGGEIVFDECYTENPLVNVLCVGVLPKDRLVLGAATGIGNIAILLGSSTGRDGIGGASVLASAGFGDAETEQSKRPSVQVGDPFEEKRLIEACLELLDRGLVVGIQDLGAAGIACATSETASRGGVGMDVNVQLIPQREPNMAPYEIMTSESQERMLAIVKPEDVAAVQAICDRWEIRSAAIGKVTEGGQLRILDGWDGEVLCDIPATTLHENAPLYHRPLARPADWDAHLAQAIPAPTEASLDEVLDDGCFDASWIFSQYDHQLFLNTVVAPGSDAAVLRLAAPGVGVTQRGIALSTDGNGRWCAADPKLGTMMLVAESSLQVACTGATPRAMVNNLNFGNPEHPEVMWQLSESVDGMTEACEALTLPVIGGNVSLYNESLGANIDPTPVIGVIGVIDSLTERPPTLCAAAGQQLWLLGGSTDAAATSLGGSRYAALQGLDGGRLPTLDLEAHQTMINLVQTVVTQSVVSAIHDVADGGLITTLAEMVIASKCGAVIASMPPAELLHEGASRVVVAVDPEMATGLVAMAKAAGVSIRELGVMGGDNLSITGVWSRSVAQLTQRWTSKLPDAMNAGAVH